MKVRIDQDGCIGCGTCTNVCRDVFVLDDDGKACIVARYRKGAPDSGEAPDNIAGCAGDAANSCPVQVISAAQ